MSDDKEAYRKVRFLFSLFSYPAIAGKFAYKNKKMQKKYECILFC
jgi:hypothetical protein